jgi:hypothetical protein
MIPKSGNRFSEKEHASARSEDGTTIEKVIPVLAAGDIVTRT